ncbi:MAG TPA: acyltransferase [Phenylobacterium sp.]|jgi:maltose O-acetyltransferase|nr:acyltransferase [Phenylobacterium sp.]
MALKSLNQLRFVRTAIIACRNQWLQLRYGVSLGSRVSVSLSARFAPGRRGDIVVGNETLIAFKTFLYTRVPSTGECRPIRIGNRCFVGGGSVILPGVTIGDESIVGGGSVVFEDVPPRCIVGGNPARVLRRNIEVGPWGRLKGADENTDKMYYGIVS